MRRSFCCLLYNRQQVALMAIGAAIIAMVGVGADEHAPALVIQHHLVEIDILRAAQCAGLVEALDFKRVILEIQADDIRIGRHGIDALFAPGAEQLQRLRHIHFRIVEFRRRRGVHHITPGDFHRIGIGSGNAAVAGDVLVKLDVHQAVFFQCMHDTGFRLARLEKAKGLGDWNLIYKHLTGMQVLLRNTVPRLDDGGILRAGGDGHISHLLEEGSNGDGVRGVVRALVDDFQHIVGTKDGGRQLHAAGAPAIGHGHFAGSEGNLVTRNGDGLEDRPADHPLCLFIEISEVVGSQPVVE
ncbi:PhnJ Carbon-Phosphorus Lyase Complex Subunit [Agrobacterium tumefaciens]|nr:PhnJ Carbon-Phosphorus Lyase Complex Subunit [Agrobacterium tumefaciens]